MWSKINWNTDKRADMLFTFISKYVAWNSRHTKPVLVYDTTSSQVWNVSQQISRKTEYFLNKGGTFIDFWMMLCIIIVIKKESHVSGATHSWSSTPVAVPPSNCCCCRMLSKSSIRCSRFLMWAGRWQLRKHTGWPNTVILALTPPLFPLEW